MNLRITSPEIRVIGPEGEQLGVMPPEEGLKKAQELGYDLVEVAPSVSPPVCRIMDYGKFKYEQNKKQHASRAHQKGVQVKELKFRPHTSQHDVEIKVRHLRRFLEAGHRAKIIIRFRGRESAHPEIAKALLDQVTQQVTAFGVVEQTPKLEGKIMTMLIVPKG